jgi:hypothetical protein
MAHSSRRARAPGAVKTADPEADVLARMNRRALRLTARSAATHGPCAHQGQRRPVRHFRLGVTRTDGPCATSSWM